MPGSELLQPRDPDTASKFAATLCIVAGGLSAAATAFVPQYFDLGMKIPIIASSLTMVLIGVLLLTAPEYVRRWLWLPTPLLGLATIVLADLGTNDATATGQVFLCAPVLYAASQLRARVAWFVTACAVLADAIITVTLLPLERALSDLVFVSGALVTITWLLVRAGDRNASLVGRLREQVAVDSLTGLVTRRVLDDAARSVVSSNDAEAGTALIMIDVDKFKTINDTWGHPVGDAALAHLADVLRSHCRPDVVISRLGGDELAVLLPGCAYDVALKRAQELVEAVRASPLELPSEELLPLSISAGVAHAPLHAEDVRGLYAAADASLYDAKRTGRDRVGREPLPSGSGVARL